MDDKLKNPNKYKELYEFGYFTFQNVNGDLHIIPFQPNHKRKHIANRGCWCHPFCEDQTEEGNLHMYKHHAIQ